jgi:uncharacterized OsmC-like protein
MADAASKTATISASSTHVAGRFILDARQNHFVADASVARGGQNEAPVATELFVASLATCALAVIVDEGAKANFKNALYGVTVSATPDDNDGTRFAVVEFAFDFKGVQKDAGNALIKAFTDVCPIYNTVARTTPVKIALSLS